MKAFKWPWFNSGGERVERKVNQKNSSAGGRVVRGDMIGGNYTLIGGLDLPEGSYIGGNLTIDYPGVTIEQVKELNLEVDGKVILNGVDVTDLMK